MESVYTLQIAICEDLPADAAMLEGYIEASGFSSERRSFESGEAFLRSFRPGLYDLVFLDIYLGGETGISVAKSIRKADKNVALAFTTASLDHTLESYRVGAEKYLEKPVKAEDVREALELALIKRKSRKTVSITAAGGKYIDIPVDDILYFEQQGHVVAVHTSSGALRTSQSVRMDEIEKRLPSPPFLRCHRSYLVNLDYVQSASREIHAFVMKNGDRVDIRRGGFGPYARELDRWRLYKTEKDEV